LCKKSSGLNAFLITTITSPRENSKQINKQEESKQKTWEIWILRFDTGFFY
jgi:hypothetical protein